MPNLDRTGVSTAPGMGKERWSHLQYLIAASRSDCRRAMAAIKKDAAKRDRVWPRNYTCWIRAPEPVRPFRAGQQE